MILENLLEQISLALHTDPTQFLQNTPEGLARRRFVVLAVIFVIESLKLQGFTLPAYLQIVRNCIAHNTELKNIGHSNAALYDFWQDCLAEIKLLLAGKPNPHQPTNKVWLKNKTEKQRLSEFRQLLSELKALEKYHDSACQSLQFFVKGAVVFNMAMLGQLQFADHNENGQHYRSLALTAFNQSLPDHLALAMKGCRQSRDIVFHAASHDFELFLTEKYQNAQKILPRLICDQLLTHSIEYYELAYDRPPERSINTLLPQSRKPTPQVISVPAAQTNPVAEKITLSEVDLELANTRFNDLAAQLEFLIAAERLIAKVHDRVKRHLIGTLFSGSIKTSRKQLEAKTKILNQLTTSQFDSETLFESCYPKRLATQTIFCHFIFLCLLHPEQTSSLLELNSDFLHEFRSPNPLHDPLILAITYQAPLATIKKLVKLGHTLDGLYSSAIAKDCYCNSKLALLFRFNSHFSDDPLHQAEHSHFEVIMLELLDQKPLGFDQDREGILFNALSSKVSPKLLRRLIDLGCNWNDYHSGTYPVNYKVPLWVVLLGVVGLTQETTTIYADLFLEYADKIDIRLNNSYKQVINSFYGLLTAFCLPYYSHSAVDNICTLEYPSYGLSPEFLARVLTAFGKQMTDINHVQAGNNYVLAGNTLLGFCCQPGKPEQTTPQEKENYRRCVGKLQILAAREDVNLDVSTKFKAEFSARPTYKSILDLNQDMKQANIESTIFYDATHEDYVIQSHILVRCIYSANDDMVEILLNAAKTRGQALFEKFITIAENCKALQSFYTPNLAPVRVLIDKARATLQTWREIEKNRQTIIDDLNKLRTITSRSSLDLATKLKFETKILQKEKEQDEIMKALADLRKSQLASYCIPNETSGTSHPICILGI